MSTSFFSNDYEQHASETDQTATSTKTEFHHAPSLLDKRELAAWLHVCVKTIDNWLLEGWLPVIQPSARIQRFNPVQVLNAMESLFGRGHGYFTRQKASVARDGVRK